MADRIIFIDLETGGLDPDKHQIIQFGGVACEKKQGFPIVEEHEVKIQLQPGRYTREALDMNSYDYRAWELEGMSQTGAVQNIKLFFQRHATWERTSKNGRRYKVAELAGHNLQFDIGFLSKLGWCNAATWTGGYLDTIQLAKWYELFSGERFKEHKLEYLCNRIKYSYTSHDAIRDALACRAVTRVLLSWMGATGF